jgi:nucleoside-diphosphate-sugar epimerase
MINIKIEHMYGPLDDENKFIYWVVNQLKQNVEKIDLTSGKQKRDFIYIDDIVNAYTTIVNNINQLSDYEEFELGTGHSIEVREFINLIYDELSKTRAINTNLNFNAVPYRDNENMDMVANISELKQLGWNPTIFIKDGIKKIINGED